MSKSNIEKVTVHEFPDGKKDYIIYYKGTLYRKGRVRIVSNSAPKTVLEFLNKAKCVHEYSDFICTARDFV